MERAETQLSKESVGADVRVRYADTDRMGVAYYATYLVWFEVGRAEYMRAAGYPYRECEEDGVILPVIRAAVRYVKPARYDDALRVDTWVSRLSRVKVTFSYEIKNRRDGTLVADGTTEHAALDPTGRPVRIPEKVRRMLIDAGHGRSLP